MIEADHRVLGEKAAEQRLDELVSLSEKIPNQAHYNQMHALYFCSVRMVLKLIPIQSTYLLKYLVGRRPQQAHGDPASEYWTQ